VPRLQRIYAFPQSSFVMQRPPSQATSLLWEYRGDMVCRRGPRTPPKLHLASWDANSLVIFSKASGLEAFSRYPRRGSISALTGRSTEYTIHVTQRFLSY